MEQMKYSSHSFRERKGGVFRTENVKNEDLELHDFTANQVLHFYFLMKKISILHSPPPTMPGKKEFLRNAPGSGRIFENSRKKLRFRDSKSEHTCP